MQWLRSWMEQSMRSFLCSRDRRDEVNISRRRSRSRTPSEGLNPSGDQSDPQTPGFSGSGVPRSVGAPQILHQLVRSAALHGPCSAATLRVPGSLCASLLVTLHLDHHHHLTEHRPLPPIGALVSCCSPAKLLSPPWNCLSCCCCYCYCYCCYCTEHPAAWRL